MPARPAAPSRPVGTVTRGTTNPNRLRRMDRWIAAAHGPALRRSLLHPTAVDLGYGAAPWTAVELLERLRTVRKDVHVYGVEIDPERVAAARPYERDGLAFVRGGFELPVGGVTRGGSRGLSLIRAANVLRQYPEADVAPAWARLCARLAPDGLLVEGTCDEIGRRHVWVALGPEGPRTVTFAARLATLDAPSDLAERLPKALIHRNVPGEPVHAFLRDFDRAWAAASPYGALGARQRWIRAAQALSADWPLADDPRRRRQGELTVHWHALAPRGAAAPN
ncbi:class I SAM-dependent methyltransferase [Streptomyces diacarni]|uniref:class I SAM-dependent methyltransferase n=1 Tax=Streptomyces diacarni TaxID=2800381 RepID=UPI003400127A